MRRPRRATSRCPWGRIPGPTLIVGAGGGDLQVYDVSDPAAPRKLSSFETPGRASRVSLDGDYAYIADTEAGVQVVDLSDPANPTLAGSYETPRPARDVSAAGSLVMVVVGDSEREGHESPRADPRTMTTAAASVGGPA